jgi:hypothetical protein
MPLEIKSDNPAGRLYWLLSNARAHNGGNSAQAFAALLHFDQNDIMQMHMRFGTTMYAIKETADLLKEVDVAYYERFLEAKPTITRFFTSFNPAADWNQYKSTNLSEADLRTLSFCSEVLSRSVPDVVVSADELKELAAQLEELYQYVVSAKIDVKLRTEILDGLEKVRQAICDITVHDITAYQNKRRAAGLSLVRSTTKWLACGEY